MLPQLLGPWAAQGYVPCLCLHRAFCAFSATSGPCQLLDFHFPWLFICSLYTLARGQARELSAFGLSCLHFIIFLFFADMLLTLFLAMDGLPSIIYSAAGTEPEALRAYKELRQPTLHILHCILSPVNPGHLISLLPLLIRAI